MGTPGLGMFLKDTEEKAIKKEKVKIIGQKG